ncbi:MAG: hypothetical protein OEY49_10615 [Candidatus Heimdallarchaeota archaeon]|nr:hypothetical protein [Candidatus Heimdallarchaeota archaeon]
MYININRIIFYTILVILSFLFVLNTGFIPNIKTVTISNDNPTSMSPEIRQWDVFLIYTNIMANDLAVGDLILTNLNGQDILHRIIEIVQFENEFYFRTKGDNAESNAILDLYQNGYFTRFDNIQGKVIIKLPTIVTIFNFINSNQIIARTILFIFILYFIYYKYFSVTKEIIININPKMIKKFTSKGQIYGIIFSFIFLQFFIPALLIGFNTTQINAVNISKSLEINEPNLSRQIIHYQVNINYSRSNIPILKIDSINISVYHHNLLLYTSLWNPVSNNLGAVEIGMSVLLNANFRYNTTRLTLVATLNYHILFLNYQSIFTKALIIPS